MTDVGNFVGFHHAASTELGSSCLDPIDVVFIAEHQRPATRPLVLRYFQWSSYLGRAPAVYTRASNKKPYGTTRKTAWPFELKALFTGSLRDLRVTLRPVFQKRSVKRDSLQVYG
jgi:hypothetical protein